MSEQHLHTGKVNEAEEVLDVVFPSGNEAAEVLHPGEQAFHSPTAAIATELATVLSSAAVRSDHLDVVQFPHPLV